MELPPIPEILAFLTSAEPEMLELMGEAAVLEAFQGAAREVPAYADLLRRHGVDPVAVTDIEAFRRLVPLTDKENTFLAYPLRELCRGGTLKGIKSIVPSSGHSGTFAFSLDTAEGAALAAAGADLAFEHVLRISERPALVVNCYPMGLQVPTSMAAANCGVNADVAIAIVKAAAADFDQLIIVGTPLFLKKLLEDGLEQGVDWKRLHTTVVAGGESFSESWRSYISRLLGIEDPDHPTTHFAASSMGAGELGLNLFHETPETIRIIRRAYKDRALRDALFGEGIPHTPHFFVYYPMKSYIEEVAEGAAGAPPGFAGELAVSHTAQDLPLPLFRYRTGDLVRLIPYRRLEEARSRHAPDLAPPGLRLPCAAVYGRRGGLDAGGRLLTAEAVKEALFADQEVARAVTGFFRARREEPGLALDVQLRPNAVATSALEARLAEALTATLRPTAELALYLHGPGEYPHQTTHERKHVFLAR